MNYQHFEKKIQDLNSTLESDKEEDSEEASDHDEDAEEEVGVSRRRKTRNKKPILDESEDEEEPEEEEHEDVDEVDSEGDSEGEGEDQEEDETWKTEIKLMLEDIPNLTSRQKERKASEFLQLPKEEVLNKLEELNGRRSSHRSSSRPIRERRAPKRYHISDEDESDFEDAKENVKPAKRQKTAKTRTSIILESDDRSEEENDSEEQNSDNEENYEANVSNGRQNSSRRPRRSTVKRSKNLLDDEENFAEFDDFDNDSFSNDRPVRERKRPTRFSEDSHDSSNRKSVYAEGKLQYTYK